MGINIEGKYVDWCGDEISKEQYDIGILKLAEFGMKYIEDMRTFEDIMKVASENLEWDMSAQEMIDFLNKNK